MSDGMNATDEAMVKALLAWVAGLSPENRLTAIETLRKALHELSPVKAMPVDYVRWVPIAKVTPNDYNPNSVARVEMQLLVTSILHDGYTQPVVTIYDAERDTFVIVDGFHRYFCMKMNEQVRALTGGLLPVVVIDKGLNDRMASTIRHNRARGKHSVQGMASLVFNMLDGGWSDAEICNELGMEPEELLRLKHITGFSKLFADREYNKAWVTRRQVLIKKQYAQEHPEEELP
jgi:ParB-like chromosome segregation protein Spo0J